MSSEPSVQQAYEQLRAAAARLERVRKPGWGEEATRLDVSPGDDGLRVHWLLNEDAWYRPEPDDKIFSEIFRLLASPPIAPWLESLTLMGHQIACNGIIDWEIEPIAYAEAPFSRLRVFRLATVESGYDTFAGTLKGKGWEDTSVATRLLERMPALEELAIPEPPKEPAFFQGPPHPLRQLLITDCANLYSCVLRLAESRRFARLEQLQLTESNRTDPSERLPASHYEQLFQSDAFPALRAVATVDLSLEQASLLRGTRIGRQLCSFEIRPELQENLFSDAFAAPFEPVTIDPDWLRWDEGLVVKLAQRIAAEGDVAAMATLAEALKQAGCTDTAILDHCLQTGPHLSDCWVLRLILGGRDESRH